ncbi:MAG: NADH-quinone oxidoreductase subunit [Clostridia bacterium]|jgi:NADH/F420H2 dehydrogenase subunit C|nr:NADH-quinone oxidoreductase subunit [Clostridia bacterium]MDN5322736.1 NADH-quinone oxidoreductase subunit [Clostridia bacterium]
MENNKNYQEMLANMFGDKINFNEEKPLEIYVNANIIVDVLKFLKEKGFSFLADISSVDYKEYFEVVYQLFSFDNSDHLTVKVKIDHENPQVKSITGLWSTANWLEREVYDLMGITFLDHPNLERILTWEGFEGHPLRKDFVSKSGRK